MTISKSARRYPAQLATLRQLRQLQSLKIIWGPRKEWFTIEAERDEYRAAVSALMANMPAKVRGAQ
jgi:hypothetical protein